MIGICFWGVATKNRRIPETPTGQPAVGSHKRVPDRQTGSFVLGGQYPITAYYVNLSGRQLYEQLKADLSILCPREWFGIKVVNYRQTQLIDALIES